MVHGCPWLQSTPFTSSLATSIAPQRSLCPCGCGLERQATETGRSNHKKIETQHSEIVINFCVRHVLEAITYTWMYMPVCTWFVITNNTYLLPNNEDTCNLSGVMSLHVATNFLGLTMPTWRSSTIRRKQKKKKKQKSAGERTSIPYRADYRMIMSGWNKCSARMNKP